MINLGLIGVGDWGKNLLRNFANLKDCQVAFVCDPDEKNLKKSSQLFPYLDFCQDYKKAVSEDQIQAVVIATPPATHYEIAHNAILAGKDIFVEKPLVLKSDQGENLCELADKKKQILMVGHIMLYHPATLRLKKYIEEGELGEVRYIYSTRVNLGKVRQEENALWSFAPHDISVILYLLGQTPLSVSCTGSCYLQAEIEDVVFLTMHFKNKVMANVHVSWLDPHKDRKLTIVGSKKMAVFDDTKASEKVWIFDKGVDSNLDYDTYAEYLSLRTGDIIIPKIESTEPLQSECQHFLDCVKERKIPRSDGKEALQVLKVLVAAQKSLKMGGTPVDVEC